MGILNFFKKKAPGQCSSCKSNVANYRCPSCGTETCEACVKALAPHIEKEAQLRELGYRQAGLVIPMIDDLVAQHMNAIRALAEKGEGVCLHCSAEKLKAIRLKRV